MQVIIDSRILVESINNQSKVERNPNLTNVLKILFLQ